MESSERVFLAKLKELKGSSTIVNYLEGKRFENLSRLYEAKTLEDFLEIKHNVKAYDGILFALASAEDQIDDMEEQEAINKNKQPQ